MELPFSSSTGGFSLRMPSYTYKMLHTRWKGIVFEVTSGFLTFLGDTEMEHLFEIG